MASDAGSMRHVFTVERPDVTRGTLGQNVTQWDTVGTMRGALDFLSGTEADVARRIVATATHRIRSWYDPDIALVTTDRLVEGSKIYNVGSIGYDQATGKLEILVTEAL